MEQLNRLTTIDQYKKELETTQKLLAVEVSKVASLELENHKLKEDLSKFVDLNLKDRVLKLEEMNKYLSDKLANEIKKSAALEEQLKQQQNNNYSNNHHNNTKSSPLSSSPSSSTSSLPSTLTSSPISQILVPKKILVPEKGSSKTFTAYLVEVQGVDPTKRYQISRRYKQFVLLHTQMIRVFGEHGLPHLPAKSNGLYFSSDDHTEKRRQGLQEYLQGILKTPSLCNSGFFLQFLKKDEDNPPVTTNGHH
eukprot:gene8406-10323_t